MTSLSSMVVRRGRQPLRWSWAGRPRRPEGVAAGEAPLTLLTDDAQMARSAVTPAGLGRRSSSWCLSGSPLASEREAAAGVAAEPLRATKTPTKRKEGHTARPWARRHPEPSRAVLPKQNSRNREQRRREDGPGVRRWNRWCCTARHVPRVRQGGVPLVQRTPRGLSLSWKTLFLPPRLGVLKPIRQLTPLSESVGFSGSSCPSSKTSSISSMISPMRSDAWCTSSMRIIN